MTRRIWLNVAAPLLIWAALIAACALGALAGGAS